jgi:hypothetical protein
MLIVYFIICNYKLSVRIRLICAGEVYYLTRTGGYAFFCRSLLILLLL